MPFVPVPLSYEAEIRMLLDGQHIENTLYFRASESNPGPDGQELASSVLTWWTATFSPAVSQNLVLNEIYVTDLSSASAPVWSQPAPAPAPHGGRALESSPNNVALCVSFRTLNRGRSYRGRNFVPGIASDDVTLNTVSATILAQLQAAYEALTDVDGQGNWEWCVVSRMANGVERAEGIATPITSVVIVDPTVDSQRRRLPGRGR